MVAYCLLLLFLATSTATCQQHSRNLGHQLWSISVDQVTECHKTFNKSVFAFQSLALPVSSMSKITQITSIVRSGRGDLVSRAPWIMLATVSAARFYTVLVEAPDTESIHPLHYDITRSMTRMG